MFSCSSITDSGRLSELRLSVGLSVRFLFSFSSEPSFSRSKSRFVRFLPFVGVSLDDLRRSVLFGVFVFSLVVLVSGVSPPRFGRLLLDSLAGLFRVRILDGDSSPANSLLAVFERLFVMLESLSHSLASSSVSELLSSVAVGSGVSSFLLFGGVFVCRVTRIRRNDPARRRRCGRLLLAPGVFFHK